MTEPVLTEAGHEILNFALNVRPPIMRERKKQKYFDLITLLMSKHGYKEAGQELVTKAIKMVEEKPFESFFQMREDPDKFRRLFLEPQYNTEAYYAQSIQVQRWDSPQSKPNKCPEEMKVVAFCASPRQGGNNDVMIDEALRGAEATGASVEKFMLHKLNIKLCNSCMKCKEPDFEPLCAIKDDLTKTIYQKIIDADAIIIGFPIYSERVCGQLAIFIDRWNCFTRAVERDKESDNSFMRKAGTKTSEKSQLSQRLFTSLLKPGRRAMVICTCGHPHGDAYDHVIEKFILKLNATKIETVEALSVGGFYGVFHGLDDIGKAMILRYPNELEKSYLAGKSLVTGER
jgi:multimeric flavodoxin WrbA